MEKKGFKTLDAKREREESSFFSISFHFTDIANQVQHNFHTVANNSLKALKVGLLGGQSMHAVYFAHRVCAPRLSSSLLNKKIEGAKVCRENEEENTFSSLHFFFQSLPIKFSKIFIVANNSLKALKVGLLRDNQCSVPWHKVCAPLLSLFSSSLLNKKVKRRAKVCRENEVCRSFTFSISMYAHTHTSSHTHIKSSEWVLATLELSNFNFSSYCWWWWRGEKRTQFSSLLAFLPRILMHVVRLVGYLGIITSLMNTGKFSVRYDVREYDEHHRSLLPLYCAVHYSKLTACSFYFFQVLLFKGEARINPAAETEMKYSTYWP